MLPSCMPATRLINARHTGTMVVIMAHGAGTENGTIVPVCHSKDYIW